MRTWISRVAIVALAVSVLTGTAAGAAGAADGDLVVQAGVGAPAPVGVLLPGRSAYPGAVMWWPGEGPKHG